ncbi:uncharacterized protein LOC128277109 [Anopheles cruzii]|uniref:uncharacterized protein LOC128277109 n=1 Tax=Anopheles cruzii TaxID=68878 RepID=UPI0022EC21F3|nr:uncharacterized protein LOC128277109 [Anopheles cruzii]
MQWNKLLLCFGFLMWCLLQVDAQYGNNCNNLMSAKTKKTLCGAKKYKAIKGVDMDKLLDCVLKGAKIVDARGAGNFESLFKPMYLTEGDGAKVNKNLESCTTKGITQTLPFQQRAHAFYKCIMNTKSKKSFKKVFNSRVCK